MRIKVSYEGGHNFDWDARLEEIANRMRADASMDFESMVRTIEFDFDGNEEDKEVSDSDLFVAAVQSTFPDFSVLRKIES